jgi:peptidoglycan/LPS O-acetylase OafA/YrhL
LISVLLIVSLGPWLGYFGIPFEDRYLAVLALPIVYWALCTNCNYQLLLLGGRASYSIYLVHGVVYIVMRRLVELEHIERIWALSLFLLLSLALALLTYKLIEQPARHWLVRQWPPQIKQAGSRP